MKDTGDKMFKLHSKYTPMGDQPEAIKKIVENINDGIADQVLLGVTGSGKTFTIANIIKETNRPALILAPNKTLAAQLYSEYKSFFPENAVEYFVSYYDYYQPEAYIAVTDTYIEKDSSINDEIEKLRQAATAALINRRDVIIVASVSAIYGLGSAETYKKMTIPIDRQTGIGRKELIQRLISIRYERNDLAFERGKFRIKGDVIDIYPSYMETGYRLEFWDEDLEEISEINTLTGQKIRKNLERIMIYPATQYLTEDGDIERIIAEIQKDKLEEVKAFEDKGKLLEAQRLKQRTEYDIEMIREIGYCKGIENYSRYLSGKKPGETPDTLLEYFPKDFVTYIDESHISIPQIRGMYNGDRARKESLVDNGFRLKAALDNRPLKFEEFRKITGQTVFVSATPGDFEIQESNGNIAEQLIRPTGILDPEIEVRPTKNQVDDLMEEIRIRVGKNQRVLVTTLTKKMAEELTEYYLGFGLRVKYMHSDIDTLERIDIIKGLRKGEFDVLVGINLLREGLDIPEVSLVAILEADKEGFLRSRRSLVQTIGRAARNVEGRVILYGDIITDSMKEAIDETNRRRKIQNQYNIENGIDPKTVIREISEDIINLDYGLPDEVVKEKDKKVFSSKTDIEKEIAKLQKEITKLSKELDFEKAIVKRDEMIKLKKLLLEF
jgi:excinuclease ABC subunit B